MPTPMITATIDLPTLDLAPHWDDLVSRAAPNVFMNPVALVAATATGFAPIRVLLAWKDEGAARKLVGIWGLQLRQVAPLWPMVLDALPYKYAFVSSPVVDPAYADPVIDAFFSAIENSTLPKALNIPSLDTEGPIFAAIVNSLARRGIEPLVLSKLSRPYVTSESGVKRTGSTRKKLRQDFNRLSALGTVEIVNDRTAPAVQPAFEAFLALEQASWKGGRGTALLSHSSDAAFVRRLIHDLATRQAASVAHLRVDGKTVAAQVLMYCGDTAYTWKIAYDASFGKYSPGTLLVDRITDELLSGPDIRAVNSCAAESSFMGQLWSGRRSMADMLVDIGPGKSLGFRMEAMRLAGYQRLRNLRDRLRGGSSLPGKAEKAA